jgi:transposase
MDALALTPDALLPDDVQALQDLVRQLLTELARLRAQSDDADALRARIDELQAKLDKLLRHRFGRRSERQPTPPADKNKSGPRKARPHGRAPLPENLERREVVYDLSEAERPCPCCGLPRDCIGEQASEQLDLEPARFFVLRTVKKSYACPHCDPAAVPAEQRFRTAGPAQVGPIAKGLCGPGLLAHVIVAKFADHTPVHRLAGQLSRCGLTLSRSTLGDWLAQAAGLARPLYELMHQRLLLSRVVHGDDTWVKLRQPGASRTRKAHLWGNLGDADYPYVVFDFTSDYTAKGPQEFFKGYQGYLQADALAQYGGLYGAGKATHCCCWAHARRKFVEAADGGDSQAHEALALIGRLYDIERELPPLLLPSDDPAKAERRRQREEQRRALRQLQAEPVLAELKQWLDGRHKEVLPKSPLGQAVSYALNHWEALVRYLEQGYLQIDNNLAERTLRAIALGRNNWVVLGSAAGGATAAVLYSLVGTCKHLGLDPLGYLREALPGLFALGDKPSTEQLQEWLPDRWRIRTRDSPPPAPPAG